MVHGASLAARQSRRMAHGKSRPSTRVMGRKARTWICNRSAPCRPDQRPFVMSQGSFDPSNIHQASGIKHHSFVAASWQSGCMGYDITEHWKLNIRKFLELLNRLSIHQYLPESQTSREKSYQIIHMAVLLCYSEPLGQNIDFSKDHEHYGSMNQPQCSNSAFRMVYSGLV